MKYLFLLAILAFLFLGGCIINEPADAEEAENSGAEPLQEENKYLLETSWGNDWLYAGYIPANDEPGFWSITIAQIFFYHKIAPHGMVSYKTPEGFVIDENLDSKKFDFEMFEEKITPETEFIQKEEMQEYIYFAAIVIKKRFGTKTYLTGPEGLVYELEEHYGCACEFYPFNIQNREDAEKAVKLIKQEIDEKMPMLLFLNSIDENNRSRGGHAATIDGYLENDGNFLVHLNIGKDSEENGWYAFLEPIGIGGYWNAPIRHIVTIRKRTE
jgi:hypothetical protein